jgi:hypothetical protein
MFDKVRRDMQGRRVRVTRLGSSHEHSRRFRRRLVRDDPDVWSGRAVQEGCVDLAAAVLHQCIRLLIGACGAPSHHGYQRARDLISGQASKWAKGVTSVRMRREGRSSIVVSSSRRHRQVRLLARSSMLSLLRAVPLFVPGRPFLRPCLRSTETRRAQGPSRLASRLPCRVPRRWQAMP